MSEEGPNLGSKRGWRVFPGAADAQLLQQPRLSGPMPWVIAIMVALTVIAAAAGLALRNTANAAAEALAGGLTVQIVEPEPGYRARQTRAAVELMRSMPSIAEVRQVPQGEIDALIEPWLGEVGSGEEAIPVPALIDARAQGAVTPQMLRDLRGALRGVAPAVRVDAQSSWLRPVFGAIRSLQWLVLALVGLLAFALAAAVLLAARSSLGANRDTIEIVHLLGGEDAQIARIFQRSMGLDAIVGGLLGLAAGLIAIVLLGRQLAALGAGLVDSGALDWTDWLVLITIPVAAAVLAMLTARLSVMRALRNML